MHGRDMRPGWAARNTDANGRHHRSANTDPNANTGGHSLADTNGDADGHPDEDHHARAALLRDGHCI